MRVGLRIGSHLRRAWRASCRTRSAGRRRAPRARPRRVQDRGDGTADLHPALPGPTVVGPQKRECILLWHLE